LGTKKMWPYKTGDCLIEVIAWAGLTVYLLHVKFFSVFVRLIN